MPGDKKFVRLPAHDLRMTKREVEMADKMLALHAFSFTFRAVDSVSEEIATVYVMTTVDSA